MTTLRSRIRVRRSSGGTRSPLVEYQSNLVGRLVVAQALPRSAAFVTTIRTDATWQYLWGAAATAPQVLKRIRLYADGLQTVRLGLMTVNNGTPTVANALIVWDYAIGGTTIFSWTGNVVLSGRYLYGYSSGAASVVACYLEYELVTP